MYSMKLPVVLQRIRLTKQRLRDVTRQALLAQECEEYVGDFVHKCEVNSDYHQYLHAQIVEQHEVATGLVLMGELAPEVAASHYEHLLEADEDETHNLTLQAAAVRLEAYYDSIETELSGQACSLKRHLATLLAQRDNLTRMDGRSMSENIPVNRKRKSSPLPTTSRAKFEAD